MVKAFFKCDVCLEQRHARLSAKIVGRKVCKRCVISSAGVVVVPNAKTESTEVN